MAQALYPPDRPQTIGEVLDTAFRIFRVSLVKCLPYGIVGVVIGQLPAIYRLATGQPIRETGFDATWIVLNLTAAILSIVVWSALILRQAAVVTGQPTSVPDELQTAARRLPALVVALILYWLAVVVGLVLLVIPGLYVSVLLSLSWNAILLKGKGPIAGLAYSARLIHGNWWRVTAILTIAFVILFVAYIVMGALVGVTAALAGAADVAVVWAFTTVIAAAVGAFIGPLSTAIALALFGDAQVRKEGVDLEARIAGATSG